MDTIGIELLINANILGNILVVDSHDMKMIYIYRDRDRDWMVDFGLLKDLTWMLVANENCWSRDDFGMRKVGGSTKFAASS